MPRKVFKYQFQADGEPVTHNIPMGAKFLFAGMQNDCLFGWFEVDSEAKTDLRQFLIVGTGHGIPDDHDWRGSMQDGSYVWHIYEAVQGGRMMTDSDRDFIVEAIQRAIGALSTMPLDNTDISKIIRALDVAKNKMHMTPTAERN